MKRYRESHRLHQPRQNHAVMDSRVGKEKDSTLSLKISRKRKETDREDIVCETIQHTGMETGLALGNESDSGFAFIGVGDETTVYRSLAHLALLGPFPSVRVRQDELYVVLDGSPYGGTGSMGLDDEGPGATEEVLKEVSEHLEGRF